MSQVVLSKFYLENQKDRTLPLEEIQAAFKAGKTLPGYRPGVIYVDTRIQLPHRTLLLEPGAALLANYYPRVAGEEPRKKVQVYREEAHLPMSKTTFAVLYHKDVLALTNERSSDAEWEVVAHLTSSVDEPEPMHPDTLIANHFKLSGGTPTDMSSLVFEMELRRSVLFWKNRALVTTEKTPAIWDEEEVTG